MPAMTMAFLDYKGAFKTVPTSEPCLTVVAVATLDGDGAPGPRN